VVVLIVALWTLVILARPLVAWKLALIGTMAGVVVLVLLVPSVGSAIFLLEVTPRALLMAVPIGAAAALLVEVSERVASAVADGRGERTAVRSA
jgi:cation-transporting ATPase E